MPELMAYQMIIVKTSQCYQWPSGQLRTHTHTSAQQWESYHQFFCTEYTFSFVYVCTYPVKITAEIIETSMNSGYTIDCVQQLRSLFNNHLQQE